MAVPRRLVGMIERLRSQESSEYGRPPMTFLFPSLLVSKTPIDCSVMFPFFGFA